MPETKTKPPPKPSLHLTWEEWLPYLQGGDAPDEVKRQFIETIWAIAMGFVDLGWRIKSTPETCGQDFDLAAALHHAVLNSEQDELPADDQPSEQALNSEEEV